MTKTRATRKVYKFRPMPRRRTQIPFGGAFTEEEFERVKFGVVHETMEDHWFICLEGRWLYFVRSWTAYCVFKVRFGQGDDKHRIVEAWASRDSSQYGSTDARYDVEVLTEVIDDVLLEGH
jgi:hypothetical protein